MKRRVRIAQALLNAPEVLILDEPTGGLDPGEGVRFCNLLSEFAHDRIVLISTHIVPDVEYIATCHAMIKDGKLLATGTTEELVKLVESPCSANSVDVGGHGYRPTAISFGCGWPVPCSGLGQFYPVSFLKV